MSTILEITVGTQTFPAFMDNGHMWYTPDEGGHFVCNYCTSSVFEPNFALRCEAGNKGHSCTFCEERDQYGRPCPNCVDDCETCPKPDES